MPDWIVETSQIYILIAVVALLIIAIVIFFVRKDKRREPLTPLAGFSLMFVLTGVMFGDDRLVAYSLMGTGILLAIIDIIIKRRKNK